MRKHQKSRARETGGGTKHNPFNVVKVAFSPKAFNKIRETIGSRPAESGGALFGRPADLRSPIPYVTDFVFDKGAGATRVTYSIDTKFLNPAIHDMWDNWGLELHGLVHSHPGGCSRPSGPDMDYFHDMHTYMERPFLITPIVFTQPDGGFRMFCYLVGPDTPAVEVDYCVMDEKERERALEESGAADEPGEKERGDRKDGAEKGGAKKAGGVDYSREADAVDVETLRKSRIVIVGTGGMYEGAGMFARSGVGEIIAIDPDTVDSTNLCRQGYLPRQVGMKKVDALGEHLREINPEVRFTGYPVKLEELTPEQEKDVFEKATVAIFTTDSFTAQAEGNKKALKYGIPAIWGGFYEKSLASEIVFHIPGVTPACFRCAVSPRYKAQEDFMAKNGREYGVSSACNTIFHSALLDAQIGMLAMAIIHNGIGGKTFSGWFGSQFDRNLVQMKVNPLYQSNLFERTFPDGPAFLFNSLWQRIEPERPPKYDTCPDCGGGEAQAPANGDGREEAGDD